MKIKTSDLTLLALNWAVAQAQGDRVFRPQLGRPDNWSREAYDQGEDNRFVTRAQVPGVGWYADYEYDPSTCWLLGGPIIEREGITTVPHSTENGVIKEWKAGRDWPLSHFPFYWGPTPLIAAMRCYVASKLGDEVDIPEELL